MIREPLCLMSAKERESYLNWLARIVKGQRGTIPDFFRNAARELRDFNGACRDGL